MQLLDAGNGIDSRDSIVGDTIEGLGTLKSLILGYICQK
jgi:hypothetical protein